MRQSKSSNHVKKSQYDSKKKKERSSERLNRNIERETNRKMINIQNLHFGLAKRESTPKSTLRSQSRSLPRSTNKENSTPRGDYYWNSSMPIEHRKAGILLNNTNDSQQ